MNTWIKLAVGLMAVVVWVGAIIAKHFWPDVDVGALVAACQSALVGLGVYHIGGAGEDKPAEKPVTPQSGFVSLALLFILAAVSALLLTSCAANTPLGKLTVDDAQAALDLAKSNNYSGSAQAQACYSTIIASIPKTAPLLQGVLYINETLRQDKIAMANIAMACQGVLPVTIP